MNELRQLKIRTTRVLSLCWSPDGRALTAGVEAGGREAGVVQWDTEGWRRLGRPWPEVISPLAVAAGGHGADTVTAAGSLDGYLTTRVGTGRPAAYLAARRHVPEVVGVAEYRRHAGGGAADEDDDLKDTILPGVNALAFSPDGRVLAAVGSQLWHEFAENPTPPQVLWLIDPRGWWFLAPARLLACDQVHDVAFAPDGRAVATASEDGVVRLVPVTADGGDHAPLLALPGNGSPVRRVRYAPDGGTVLGASVDGAIREWSAVDGGERRSARPPAANGLCGMDLSPDGRTLALGDFNGTVTLFDVPGWRAFGTFASGSMDLRGLAWSPCGSMLAVGGWDLRVWRR